VQVVPSASGFSARIAWCAPDSWLGSPMVTTTDGTANARTSTIVWAANDHLWAYDADTGQKLFTGSGTAMSTSVQGWNTPIGIGAGRIAVGVNGQLYVFGAP
jgi:outer membrane protein assembly factor BamB